MSDNFEILADVDATETEAGPLALTVIQWMVDNGIIVGETSDCVLGAPAGYPPGPRYSSAVTAADEWLHRLATNGVEVTVGRSVFHPSETELGPVVCPRCGSTVVLEHANGSLTDHWRPFADALDSWHAGGPGDVPCASCGRPIAFNDWIWKSEFPFAVGYLGFTFWNWPPLRDTFISEVIDLLGHRLVHTRGRL